MITTDNRATPSSSAVVGSGTLGVSPASPVAEKATLAGVVSVTVWVKEKELSVKGGADGPQLRATGLAPDGPALQSGVVVANNVLPASTKADRAVVVPPVLVPPRASVQV